MKTLKQPKDLSGFAMLRIWTKAELLLLNCTQFPSLGIFVSKKLEIEKTKTTFIISVLKAVYKVPLVFSKSNFFINKYS